MKVNPKLTDPHLLVATIPQGCVRPDVGNLQEVVENGAAEQPSTRQNALR